MTIDLSQLALQVPQILVPNPRVDLHRWAVIACDQYTSEPAYWQEVDRLVGDHPSTLRLVFPEVYLEADEDETAARIAAINRTMQQYLADGTLRPLEPGFVLVDRKTAHAPSRKGLVVALDLEAYDYRPGADTLIRATEGTIVDRLPPRIRVRENASIELPHIMVLIDDPEHTVIEPLFDRDLPPLYDFELMLGGGHLRGWHVAGGELIGQVAERLAALAAPERFRQRYAETAGSPMLYAMGDGNHSFATAKAIWETLKAEAEDPTALMQHPARYALVELVNLHDPGLEFEAIHRAVFDVDVDAMAAAAQDFFAAAGTPCQWRWLPDARAVEAERTAAPAVVHAIPFVAGDRHGLLTVAEPAYTLVVATLQAFLDDFLPTQPAARIDYIHGDAAVIRLGSKPQAIGFSLPAISKHDLFRTIVKDGALPRKTFSMGEADEKRFYLEARRITP
ncbi:MAG TPA: DUF1015 domain-containing protein [Desulfuromonadales bacterium]|nr:DUF1015 domain-containing protein [Desulfuromonadales bacterium]